MVYDTSKAFWDRWILLEFPYTFVTKEELEKNKTNKFLKLREEGIIERIVTPQEMSGLLNKFLDGLDRVMDFKTFSSTKGSEDVKELWIRKSNSFMAFCLDCLEEDYDNYITKKDLRKHYVAYCKKHKINPKSDFVIKKTIQELFGASEDRKFMGEGQVFVWEGIKWKEKK
jgi:phage/plasmid-associated DNA primase